MAGRCAVDAAFLRAAPLPKPGKDAGKDERGTVLVVAGSAEVPGAALLAAQGALRAGAGKLQVATVRSAAMHLAVAIPEARVIALEETAGGEIDPAFADRLRPVAERADAIVVGPGMVEEEGARRVALALFEYAPDARFLIDAAAITGLRGERARLQALRDRLVITPHAGEIATFLGLEKDAVLADPEAAGCAAAQAGGCMVTMKGTSTFICGPGGEPSVCEGGGIGMATSGSGDVLAGIVGGLMARGAPPLLAAQWGTYLHAESGRRLTRSLGRVGFLARELLDRIPAIMDELDADPALDPR